MLAICVLFSPLFWDVFSRPDSGSSFKARYLFGLGSIADFAGADRLSDQLWLQAWLVDEVSIYIGALNLEHAAELDLAIRRASHHARMGYAQTYRMWQFNRARYDVQIQDLECYRRHIIAAGGWFIDANDYYRGLGIEMDTR